MKDFEILTKNPCFDTLRLYCNPFKNRRKGEIENIIKNLKYSIPSIKNGEINGHLMDYKAGKVKMGTGWYSTISYAQQKGNYKYRTKIELIDTYNTISSQTEASMNKFVNGDEIAVSNNEMNNSEVILEFSKAHLKGLNMFFTEIINDNIDYDTKIEPSRVDLNYDIEFNKKVLQKSNMEMSSKLKYSGFNKIYSDEKKMGYFIKLEPINKSNPKHMYYDKTEEINNKHKFLIDGFINRYEIRWDKSPLVRSNLNYYVQKDKIYSQITNGKLKPKKIDENINRDFKKYSKLNNILKCENHFSKNGLEYMKFFSKDKDYLKLLFKIRREQSDGITFNNLNKNLCMNEIKLIKNINKLKKFGFLSTKREKGKYLRCIIKQEGDEFCNIISPLVPNDVREVA